MQPPRPRPPSAEEFHLGYARRAYVEGHITVEEFEHHVGVILRGGTSGELYRRLHAPARPSPMVAEVF